ncbi:hypothetical protein [Dactylosporangium sp. CA-233914]|uniref:hypothetical protein n=1 Tax=Dactylosporangium sp. CA-233914 TaxID=3239934 RepID=UPI003D8DAC35
MALMFAVAAAVLTTLAGLAAAAVTFAGASTPMCAMTATLAGLLLVGLLQYLVGRPTALDRLRVLTGLTVLIGGAYLLWHRPWSLALAAAAALAMLSLPRARHLLDSPSLSPPGPPRAVEWAVSPLAGVLLAIAGVFVVAGGVVGEPVVLLVAAPFAVLGVAVSGMLAAHLCGAGSIVALRLAVVAAWGFGLELWWLVSDLLGPLVDGAAAAIAGTGVVALAYVLPPVRPPAPGLR